MSRPGGGRLAEMAACRLCLSQGLAALVIGLLVALGTYGHSLIYLLAAGRLARLVHDCSGDGGRGGRNVADVMRPRDDVASEAARIVEAAETAVRDMFRDRPREEVAREFADILGVPESEQSHR